MGRLDPENLDPVDACRRSRVDVDDQSAVGRRRPGRDARGEPAGVPIVLAEEGGDVGNPFGRHRGSHPAPDEVGRLLDRPAEGIEHLDSSRGAQRHQVVPQADTLRRGGGTDANVDEVAQTEQMGEALADLPHRQRLAGTGLDEVEQGGLVEGPPVAEEPDLRDRLSRERRGIGGGGRRRKHQRGPHRAGDGGAVQNACLMRKSRA